MSRMHTWCSQSGWPCSHVTDSSWPPVPIYARKCITACVRISVGSALLVVSPSLSSWNLWFGAGLWWCAILQPSHRCNHRKVRQLPGTKQITYALASTLAGCTHARNDVTSWWGNGRITVMIQPWCNRYLLPYHFISGFQHFSNIQLKPHGFGKSNLAI